MHCNCGYSIRTANTIYDRLFYVGPSRQYMRLVVLSEEEKRSVLTECHNNPGTGNHSGVRGTQNRVIAGYYWPTIIQDVKEWVISCHRCQLNDPIKTVVPVLHSIKVKEPWEVLGLDLIGPLPETARNNKYVLTMTDLYTKWVIAEPMQSKTAAEVSAIITTKLYLFGMVRKIITDQGKEFVCKVKFMFFPPTLVSTCPPYSSRKSWLLTIPKPTGRMKELIRISSVLSGSM
uniref:Integrase catalytic domain-containing protein n=1 Tax=Sinocyclocheilus grahami TaxID=75366 RepID=A0A672L726_SINGR